MSAKSPPFLMWYDDNPKLSVTQKIEAAIHAYCTRFRGTRPTLVLVNEEEVTEFAGVQVRGVTTVRRYNYWVGQDERLISAPVEAPAPAPAAHPAPQTARSTRRRKAAS